MNFSLMSAVLRQPIVHTRRNAGRACKAKPRILADSEHMPDESEMNVRLQKCSLPSRVSVGIPGKRLPACMTLETPRPQRRHFLACF
jgi:hypothetical protein